MACRVRRGIDHAEGPKLAKMLTVATGLLTLEPTVAFAPYCLNSVGVRKRACGAMAPRGLKISGDTSGSLSRLYRGLRMMSGVAEEEAVDTSSKGNSPEVVNNDMTPFVASPRREPKEWFEAVKAQVGPRPEFLSELSKAGEAQLATVSLPIRSQEPYRYADLESLYRTDFYAAPLGGAVSETITAAVDEYRMEVSKGQQLVFMNGVFSPSLSDVSGLASLEGVVAGHLGDVEGEMLEQAFGSICCPLGVLGRPKAEGYHEWVNVANGFLQVKDIMAFLPETDASYRTTQGSLPFCCLNQACFADAAVILVGDGVHVERPIQVIFVSDGLDRPTVSHPRLVVKAGADSHLSFTQGYISRGGVCLSNGFTRVLLGPRANVEHDYMEEMGPDDRFVDTVSVSQTWNSTYSVNQVLAGGFDARANLQIELTESGSHCNVYGAALTTGNQRQDFHTTIHHKAVGTTCTQEQRNVVTDKADCVFKGRIAIDGVAQLTDAAQLCRTLLVSNRARVTVMPSMEIIANDVKCTHGATICDLEDEELFYLMSRGINRLAAKALVITSFADVVILRFVDSALRGRVKKKLLDATPEENRAVKGIFNSI